MTRSRKRISKKDAFVILRRWHKNRELLLLETFRAADRRRGSFFVTTTEIDEGKPSILVTETQSFEGLEIKIEEARFFEIFSKRYPSTLLLTFENGNEAELSEIGKMTGVDNGSTPR
jgi:hypothetical protein